MDHTSRTAWRRSRTRAGLGDASSRPYHTFRRVVSAGDVLREACRSLGRRLAADARSGLDAATFGFALLACMWSRRPAPAPIPLDASSAKFRRSRMNHRR